MSHADSSSLDLESKRRRVPRRSYFHRVGLLIGGQYFIKNSWEIGEGGMLIDGPEETSLSEGRLILLTFRLPGFGHTVVRGVIRYIQSGGIKCGIEFIDLDFHMKRNIRVYVASKLDHENQLLFRE